MTILATAHDLTQFRLAVRDWLNVVLPPARARELAAAKGEELIDAQRWWMAERCKEGLATPHWPTAFGGADLSLSHQIILADEFARAGSPSADLFMISLNHLPGTLIPYGTTEQQRLHLPRVKEGVVWCQGFSEPSAGSDLAALRTRAELDGEDYVVNGQKIWSTFAMFAQWCILLVRTDFDAKKQKGITYLLLDMASPGIEVRPIKKSTGTSFFGEIFLTDVRVPAGNRVGLEHDGWSVAQATLASERGVLVFDAMERLRHRLERYWETAVTHHAAWLEDDRLRRDFLTIFGDLQALRRQIRRLLKDNEHGSADGWSMTPSLVKLISSTLRQRIGELQVRIAGLDSQILRNEAGSDSSMYDYLDSYGFTISAGTNEIMRNLIAERGLGLPKN